MPVKGAVLTNRPLQPDYEEKMKIFQPVLPRRKKDIKQYE